MTYQDYCGKYRLTQHRDGTVTVLHIYRTAWGGSFKKKVGEYKSLQGAKIGLAKYCGGMPQLVKEA